MRTLVLLLVTTTVMIGPSSGCSGSDGRPPPPPAAGAGEVSFHGEQLPLPGFMKDTGYLPDGSPIQVKLQVGAQGKLSVDAKALAGGSAVSPTLYGEKGSGQFSLDVTFVFQVSLKISGIPGVPDFEGPLMGMGVPDINLKVDGMAAAFDPFLLGGQAHLEANVPETMVAMIPLAAAGLPPPLDGSLNISVSGTVKSDFTGVCAAVAPSSGGASAQYIGQTATSASLKITPVVTITGPLGLDQSTPPFDIPLEVPAITADLDLGTRMITGFSATAASAGGSQVTSSTCSGATPGDGGPAGDGGAGGGDVVGGGDGGSGQGEDGSAGLDLIVGADRPTGFDLGSGDLGSGTASCVGVVNCIQGCADQTCADACLASGTPEAQAEAMAVFQCLDAFCSGECATDASQCGGCLSANCSQQDAACGFSTCRGEGQVCSADSDCCGGSCTNGTCGSPASTCDSTCGGCCDSADRCQTGTDAASCGVDGARCAPCGSHRTCMASGSGGACHVDPASLWGIMITSGTIPATNSGGGSWDPLNGSPDPYVTVVVDASSGSTSRRDDSLSPVWNETVLSGLSASDILTHNAEFEVFDYDFPIGDDTIGFCGMVIPESAFDGAEHDAGTCDTAGLSVRFQLVPQ
jgi:hypothetical protein